MLDRAVGPTERTIPILMTNSSSANGRTGRAKSSSTSKNSKPSGDEPMLRGDGQSVILRSAVVTSSSKGMTITTTELAVTLTGELTDWPVPYLQDPEPEFYRYAACRGSNPEVFYPPTGPGEPPPDYSQAQAICDACPVEAQCLDHALTWPEKHGYWGGMSERARRLYLRRLNRGKGRRAT